MLIRVAARSAARMLSYSRRSRTSPRAGAVAPSGDRAPLRAPALL